jgi:hypothetical protein
MTASRPSLGRIPAGPPVRPARRNALRGGRQSATRCCVDNRACRIQSLACGRSLCNGVRGSVARTSATFRPSANKARARTITRGRQELTAPETELWRTGRRAVIRCDRRDQEADRFRSAGFSRKLWRLSSSDSGCGRGCELQGIACGTYVAPKNFSVRRSEATSTSISCSVL